MHWNVSIVADMHLDMLAPYLANVVTHRRYLHTIFTQHTNHLKYPWTASEMQANCLLQAFSGAVALARRLDRQVRCAV